VNAPANGNGPLRDGPIPKLTGLALDNSGSGFAQACSERRQVDLLWLTAKSLVHIDTTLGDLLVLQQQEVDLLRRLVERSATR
jgi:hypothetical protein